MGKNGSNVSEMITAANTIAKAQIMEQNTTTQISFVQISEFILGFGFVSVLSKTFLI